MDELNRLFTLQKEAAAAELSPSLQTRRDRLKRLLELTLANRQAFARAISDDFGGRARQETELADILPVAAGARHAIAHLARWMRPRRMPTALHFRPGRNVLIPQPLGVAGIVSPWNYPLQLAFSPAIGALAAGNRVLLKPSELTPAFSGLLQELVAKSFAPEEMAVVTGDAEIGRAFVGLPFDHLLFTGSTAVGRLVAAAAAPNLTPTTLELGGKSPVILDPSADLDLAARRIAFGKLFNAGQTCVAPDYALVPKESVGDFVQAFIRQVGVLYPRLIANPDYSAIVSDRHVARLDGLLAEAAERGAQVMRINPAGETPQGRKLLPAVVEGADETMRIMAEEIFGPILPVIAYDRLDEALAFVNRRPRPLALYWFGQDRQARQAVLAGSLSGGVTINDCLLHFIQESQPVGGVGASGIGAYHGEAGFKTFSKEKPVFIQGRFSSAGPLLPPYGRLFDAALSYLRRFA